MQKDLNKTTVYKLQKTGKYVARQTLYNVVTGKEKNITGTHDEKEEAIRLRDKNVEVIMAIKKYVDYRTAKELGIIKKKPKKAAKNQKTTDELTTKITEIKAAKKPAIKKHWTMKLKEMKGKYEDNKATLDEEITDLKSTILPYLTETLYKKPEDADNILFAKALNDLLSEVTRKNMMVHDLTSELKNTNTNTENILDQFDVLYNMIPYNCYISKCKDIFALGYKYTVEVSDPLTNELKLKFTTNNKFHGSARYIAKHFGLRVINY